MSTFREYLNEGNITLQMINARIKEHKKYISKAPKGKNIVMGDKAVSNLYVEIEDLPYGGDVSKMRKAIKVFEEWVSALSYYNEYE